MDTKEVALQELLKEQPEHKSREACRKLKLHPYITEVLVHYYIECSSSLLLVGF